jgi:hypothetical protein
MLYDKDPITRQLEQSPFYDQSDDAFGAFKETFSVASPEWRLENLKGVDAWLSLEDRPTKDHARLLNMKRELQSIHDTMRKAGR